MTEIEKPVPLKPWTEPRVEVLDVSDTEMFVGRGNDGKSFPNSTRS